jgi:hypothetical protein
MKRVPNVLGHPFTLQLLRTTDTDFPYFFFLLAGFFFTIKS